jgi:hypothetical protein
MLKKNRINEKILDDGDNSNANLNNGMLTNAINTLYNRKESYSHIHTYYPSNAFPSYKILLKLLSKLWNSMRIHIKGFKRIKIYNKLIFFQNIDNPKIIFVGIKDTDSKSLHELYTGVCNTVIKIDMRKLDRYINDLKDLIEFQKKYPTDKYYYIATGISIAGVISDLFLDEGYIDEAITFNAVIEDRFISNPNIKNFRIYLDEDIFYLGMGKFAPNTKVYSMNVVKQHFINPIEELQHLYKLHTLHSQNSSSLSFLKKIFKTDKYGDNGINDNDNRKREDWVKLFNKRLNIH